MGIKFHCPNGHKLNVKATDPATGKSVAGKKGVCPKCGAKFRIPAASELNLVDSDLEETEAAAGAAAAGGAPIPAKSPNGAATPAGAIQSAGAVTSGSSAPTVGSKQPSSPSAGPSSLPGTAEAASAAPTGPKSAPAFASNRTELAADPITESPQSVWYVRPPTGGQYGPARGEIMRKWLSEGRVSTDSLVWREGWTDWQLAGTTFPQLKSAGGTAAAPAVTTPTITAPSNPAATRTAARYQTKKRDSSSQAIMILVFLGIACLVLVAVLVYVLVNLK